MKNTIQDTPQDQRELLNEIKILAGNPGWDDLAVSLDIEPRTFKNYRMPDDSSNYRNMHKLVLRDALKFRMKLLSKALSNATVAIEQENLAQDEYDNATEAMESAKINKINAFKVIKTTEKSLKVASKVVMDASNLVKRIQAANDKESDAQMKYDAAVIAADAAKLVKAEKTKALEECRVAAKASKKIRDTASRSVLKATALAEKMDDDNDQYNAAMKVIDTAKSQEIQAQEEYDKATNAVSTVRSEVTASAKTEIHELKIAARVLERAKKSAEMADLSEALNAEESAKSDETIKSTAATLAIQTEKTAIKAVTSTKEKAEKAESVLEAKTAYAETANAAAEIAKIYL